MYIRCKKFSNSTRRVLGIYHSIRTGAKVSQKLVKYIGTAHTDEQYAILMKVAQDELKTFQADPLKRSGKTSTCNECKGVLLSQITEEYRVIEGFHDIYGVLLDRLKLGTCLTKYRYKQLKDVIIARIACPSSKLHTAQMLSKDFGKSITANQIYRLMDEILTHENEIKLNIFEFSKQISEKQKIDLLFFDVTTLYFESQKADEIRDFGYSKDHKIGEVQVVLALATTTSGLPVGYHLFPGKTAEVKTLLACLETWRKIFTIDQVTVIADRAMMSEVNLSAMENAKIEYIVAAKLKSLPKQLQKQILSRNQEEVMDIHGEPVQIQEQVYKKRRLVIGFSARRQEKDKGDRERLVSNLKSKVDRNNTLDIKKLVTNRGYLKFADEQQKGNVILNEEKIKQEALWDGLHGVITNKHQASPRELLTCYKRLWVIEESFRINKHTLAMRPIYHYSPKRIKAHILICYIAFAVSRYLQHHVSAFNKTFSIEKIREVLFSVQSSLLKDTETDILYRLPSKMSAEAKIIYNSFNIKRLQSPSKMITARRM